MNIAVLCHASAGGSGVVATELGVEVSRLGHSVHFVANQLPFRLSMLPRDFSDTIFFHQVGAFTYPLFDQPLTTLNTANVLVDVILEQNIDIVHAHYAIPHATSAIMAREMTGKTKVITTLHGTDVTLVGMDAGFKHSTRYALERSDTVTAVSHYLAEQTRDTLGIDVPIKVIYNMVDTQRFVKNPDARFRARFAHPDEFLVVHISNFRKIKRTEDVIETFAKISSEVPARLLMIGDGPERGPAFELAQKLGVIGRTHFLGSFPNVENILGIADLFLLPSSQESFGLVALEAMSCEVPVIASRIGGIPEVVVHGETGYMCELGDTDDMASKALELLQNPETFARFAKAARQRAEVEFHPHKILPQYMEAYSELMPSPQLR
jgi:L-malate glycosyltransferase